MNKRNFTILELLIVVAVIGILMTLLLPSLSTAKEKARFAVCMSQRDQNYKLISLGVRDNNYKMPQFYYWKGNNQADPDYATDDWMGAAQKFGYPKSTKKAIVNPVAGHYLGNPEWTGNNPPEVHDIAKILKCPSIESFTEPTATSGSNGVFDYSFTQSFTGLVFHKLETEVTWNGINLSTPLIVEEDPRYNMGHDQFYRETSWANGDSVGTWHDYGKKGGYTGIDGSTSIIKAGPRFNPEGASMNYNGELKTIKNFTSISGKMPSSGKY
ncbi:MAG: type II secretion system GspH family protein [Lentisphaeraceae bacterium]|nr:type II secretion system GspH family protein [Lentisphaeraceae bacterium]